VNGLLAPDGKMVFPNADIWSAQPDSDFWLSLDVAAKASEGFQPFFKFARTAKEKLQVGGMHLPFSGVGHARAEGKGYAWVPVEFGLVRE
jgi:hypothetical protein